MSSCSDNSCGIGGWGGPLPGDPDNNSVLRATPAYGGIDVTWSWPVDNPHAVAHVRLYRALLPDFAAATQHAVVAGDFFHDRLSTAVQYYYWIQIVSVNGTVGAVIGPATAVARPTIDETIDQLSGLIDAGMLSQSLKERLDKITLIDQALASEVTSRQSGEITLAEAVEAADAKSGQALTFLYKEVQDRITTNSALVNAIDLQAVTLQGRIALAQSQILTSVDEKDLVLSQRIDTVSTGYLGAVAQVRTDMQAKIDVVTGNVNTLATTKASASDLVGVQTALQASINGVTGAVNAMYTAKVDVNGLVGGFGLANNGTTVEAGFDVDRFWIGRTTANKRKPFIIENGTVYIDEAAISKLTFNKLRDESGSFIVENGRVKANYLKVATASIDDLAVTNGKIENLAVSAAKISDLAVTSAKIDNLAVTTGKIANLAVTTLNVAGNAITAPVQSRPEGLAKTTYTGSPVTTITLGSITTDANGQGRVTMWLAARAALSSGVFALAAFTANNSAAVGIWWVRFTVRRNGVAIAEYYYQASTVGGATTFNPTMLHDNPGVGVACTYTLEVASFMNSNMAMTHEVAPLDILLLETKR